MNATTRLDGDDGCGHLPSDPVCKCWGVYSAQMWALIDGSSFTNYDKAFLAAYEFRRMDPGGRYRVQRREALGEAVDKTAAPVALWCDHTATDASCACYIVHYRRPEDGSDGLVTPYAGAPPMRANYSDACRTRDNCQRAWRPWTFEVRRYTETPMKAPPWLCQLPWCAALTTERFCSDRCRDFGARVYVAEQRLVDFSKQLTARREARQRLLAETRAEIFKSRGLPYTVKKGKKRKRKPSAEPLRGIPSELAWAREQTMADINAIERAWHAVQHESAVGDERFFPLLHDDE